VARRLLRHSALLRDVDTVQKLTDILILGHGGLLDLGARQRHLVDINTRDLDLVLHVRGAEVIDTVQQRDPSDLLLTQKVADLDNGLVTFLDRGHVDREMGVTEAHLVLEASLDTVDHVLDVRAHSSTNIIETVRALRTSRKL
jgi:hypothetical protein